MPHAAMSGRRTRIALVGSGYIAGVHLQVLRAALGHNHPRLADGYVALGEVHLGRGQFGAAEQAFGRALELRESMLGTDHPELVEVLEGRVAVLRATSRDEEAGEAVARVEAIREKLTA